MDGIWKRGSTRSVDLRGKREATSGFEPLMGVLQTPALPLGYVARYTRIENSITCTGIKVNGKGRKASALHPVFDCLIKLKHGALMQSQFWVK
jgi:hypothetical protein